MSVVRILLIVGSCSPCHIWLFTGAVGKRRRLTVSRVACGRTEIGRGLRIRLRLRGKSRLMLQPRRLICRGHVGLIARP